jgi:hypothetical protein
MGIVSQKQNKIVLLWESFPKNRTILFCFGTTAHSLNELFHQLISAQRTVRTALLKEAELELVKVYKLSIYFGRCGNLERYFNLHP